MTKKLGDPQAPNRVLSSWPEIVKCLGEFPSPETSVDYGGEVAETAWVFRGLKNRYYELQPTIEREVKSKVYMGWSTLEALVSSEFKARARMHLSPPLIPDDELTWLALMQHYAVPTKLLDLAILHSSHSTLQFAPGMRGSTEGTFGFGLWTPLR